MDGNNLFTLAAKWKSSAESVGGIKSIKIDNETAKGDKAKVTATLTNGDDSTSTSTFNLEKKDGKWVVVVDEATLKAASGEE